MGECRGRGRTLEGQARHALEHAGRPRCPGRSTRRFKEMLVGKRESYGAALESLAALASAVRWHQTMAPAESTNKTTPSSGTQRGVLPASSLTSGSSGGVCAW